MSLPEDRNVEGVRRRSEPKNQDKQVYNTNSLNVQSPTDTKATKVNPGIFRGLGSLLFSAGASLVNVMGKTVKFIGNEIADSGNVYEEVGEAAGEGVILAGKKLGEVKDATVKKLVAAKDYTVNGVVNTAKFIGNEIAESGNVYEEVGEAAGEGVILAGKKLGEVKDATVKKLGEAKDYTVNGVVVAAQFIESEIAEIEGVYEGVAILGGVIDYTVSTAKKINGYVVEKKQYVVEKKQMIGKGATILNEVRKLLKGLDNTVRRKICSRNNLKFELIYPSQPNGKKVPTDTEIVLMRESVLIRELAELSQPIIESVVQDMVQKQLNPYISENGFVSNTIREAISKFIDSYGRSVVKDLFIVLIDRFSKKFKNPESNYGAELIAKLEEISYAKEKSVKEKLADDFIRETLNSLLKNDDNNSEGLPVLKLGRCFFKKIHKLLKDQLLAGYFDMEKPSIKSYDDLNTKQKKGVNAIVKFFNTKVEKMVTSPKKGVYSSSGYIGDYLDRLGAPLLQGRNIEALDLAIPRKQRKKINLKKKSSLLERNNLDPAQRTEAIGRE